MSDKGIHPQPKFSFVVLHYKTWWDTIECVNSMLSVSYANKHIVIVNNDSNDDNKKKLQDSYGEMGNVTLLNNDENLGFSLGNNVGFSYAKNKLNSEFIALSNNDILVEGSDFVDKIVAKHETSPFDILGPDIISTVDYHNQNPRVEHYNDIANTEKFIANFRNLLWLSYLNLDLLLVSLKKKIIPESHLPLNKKVLDHINEQWGVKLHGSFWVFSPSYIANYDGLYPLKSMQMEESFLNYIAKRDHLKTVYYPNCKVYHKEDSSTNFVHGKGVRKRRFYYKNCLRSCKELLKLMKNDKQL